MGAAARRRRPAGSLPWLVGLVLAAACGREPEPEPPLRGRDVVVVLVDTLRADVLAPYGHAPDLAPFVSRLAREGVVFDRARSASSWTAPATASIFTSLYPDQHGVVTGYLKVRNQADGSLLNRLPPEAETLAEVFHAAGYRTFGLVDNPTVTERMGFARGFDLFEVSDYRGARHVADRAIELGPRLAGEDAPYFLYLHLMDPHKPYKRHPWMAPVPEGADRATRLRAAYESEVAYLDRHLARAFQALGIDGEETLVVFTADHGEEFGDHGGIGHAPQLYEELTHVPLVVRGPSDLVAPGRVAANVSSLDLLPTFRELLGLPPGAQDEGRSLAPALTGAAPPGDRPIFSMRTRDYAEPPLELRAVVSGTQKLIVDRLHPAPELYDLEADPGERENRAGREPAAVEALEDVLRRREGRPRRFERSYFPLREGERVDLEELERLGYVEGGGD